MLLRAKKPTLPEIKIAAVSAYSDEETRKRSQQAGIEFYLTKPVSNERVKQIITAVFGHEANHRQNENILNSGHT